jgi:hypothetical protein
VGRRQVGVGDGRPVRILPGADISRECSGRAATLLAQAAFGPDADARLLLRLAERETGRRSRSSVESAAARGGDRDLANLFTSSGW